MTADADGERPAFYALAPGGWRDWWTLLHPPYTAWHLSYVAFGAVTAVVFSGYHLFLALAGFFLGVGVTAHALDELTGPAARDPHRRRAAVDGGADRAGRRDRARDLRRVARVVVADRVHRVRDVHRARVQPRAVRRRVPLGPVVRGRVGRVPGDHRRVRPGGARSAGPRCWWPPPARRRRRRSACCPRRCGGCAGTWPASRAGSCCATGRRRRSTHRPCARRRNARSGCCRRRSPAGGGVGRRATGPLGSRPGPPEEDTAMPATTNGDGHADLILRGGHVYTADAVGRHADAVAIRGGRIVAVGFDGDVGELRGPGTRVVDVRGGLVLPGFQDAHCHPPTGGLSMVAGRTCTTALTARGLRRRHPALGRRPPRRPVDRRRRVVHGRVRGRQPAEGAAGRGRFPTGPCTPRAATATASG